MGSESIAYSAFGLMGYWLIAHSGREIIVKNLKGAQSRLNGLKVSLDFLISLFVILVNLRHP